MFGNSEILIIRH